MVQKKVIAHSRVSSSKVSMKRKIEDFTGNHSASDITPIPLDLDTSQIEKIENTVTDETIGDDAFGVDQINVTTPPPTIIPDSSEDELHKTIKNFINGRRN